MLTVGHSLHFHPLSPVAICSCIDKLQLDIAGRYERFSDFGDASVGKLTSRYDFTDAFAVRGTFSTGLHAPTLAEESTGN